VTPLSVNAATLAHPISDPAPRVAGEPELPELQRLDRFLTAPEILPAWRIERLLPTGGNALLAAQFKSGKTTFVANLLRCLVDDQPFLDRFPITRGGDVALVDLELAPTMLRRWLREQSIVNDDAVQVVALRGRVRQFDILNDSKRSRWADRFREAGTMTLIIDPLRPIFDAFGLDENHDAGLVLSALDALKADAGISELLVAHHAGHGSERARGDSRFLDWPDALWTIVRGDGPLATAPRYVSATGRDVDVPESRLQFDPPTRRLSLAGGNRRDAETQAAAAAITAALRTGGECLSIRQVEAALDGAHPRNRIREALEEMRQSGAVTTMPGARRAILHCLPEAHHAS
jgi:hypothetical protein